MASRRLGLSLLRLSESAGPSGRPWSGLAATAGARQTAPAALFAPPPGGGFRAVWIESDPVALHTPKRGGAAHAALRLAGVDAGDRGAVGAALRADPTDPEDGWLVGADDESLTAAETDAVTLVEAAEGDDEDGDTADADDTGALSHTGRRRRAAVDPAARLGALEALRREAGLAALRSVGVATRRWGPAGGGGLAREARRRQTKRPRSDARRAQRERLEFNSRARRLWELSRHVARQDAREASAANAGGGQCARRPRRP